MNNKNDSFGDSIIFSEMHFLGLLSKYGSRKIILYLPLTNTAICY